MCFVLSVGLAEQTRGDDAMDLDRLKTSMTFYASFDQSLDGDFALGDPRIYSTGSMKAVADAKPGLGQAKRVVRVERGGVRDGGALHFTGKGSSFPFFRGNKNINDATKNWEGTVSFSLKVDPAKNPGFNDPIQVTDADYKESAIWVDFTKNNPREFRLAVVCDRQPNGKRLERENRVVAAKSLPFSGDQWTQITITWSALNTDHGEAHMYFDGEHQASVVGVYDPFTLDSAKSRIHMGLGYTGMFDELSAFNRSLSPAEVKALHKLKRGAADLLSKDHSDGSGQIDR
ncbi:MAG: LamG-like jellyroll fold domain-containing protein [Fuerstiella sp.]